jgi:hypothetical protein
MSGKRLTDTEVSQVKEIQKEYQLSKKNKSKKNKVDPKIDLGDWTLQQTSTYSYGGDDMEDPLKRGYRLLTTEDVSLTTEEREMLEKAGYKLFCCLCCDDTAKISEIIGRNVYSCGTCYCCMGDDPYGDICTVYVNDETRSLYMTASKKDIEDLAKFSKEYDKKSKEFRQACDNFRQLEKLLESDKNNMTPEEYENKLNEFKINKEKENEKFKGFGYIS